MVVVGGKGERKGGGGGNEERNRDQNKERRDPGYPGTGPTGTEENSLCVAKMVNIAHLGKTPPLRIIPHHGLFHTRIHPSHH